MSGKEKSKTGSGLKELLKLYRFLKPYRWKFALVTEKTLASIRQHVYNHLIKLPMAFFAERRYSKKAQSYVAESNTIVEETLQGIQNVKAFTNESFEINRYREKTDEVTRAGIKGVKYQAAVSFIVLGFFVAIGAVIWRGATFIAKGQMEAGQLFSFVIYSGFIAGNIAGMAVLLL